MSRSSTATGHLERGRRKVTGRRARRGRSPAVRHAIRYGAACGREAADPGCGRPGRGARPADWRAAAGDLARARPLRRAHGPDSAALVVRGCRGRILVMVLPGYE
jgi:hypothetical protein